MPIKDWARDLGMERSLQDEIAAGQTTLAPTIAEGSYEANQTIEGAKTRLNLLAGLAIPTVFKYLYPPVLLAVWSMLLKFVKDIANDPKLALGIPRGFGKTTIVKLFILYCILFTNCKFILVISSTATLAENIIADVVDMLNESNIIRLFTDWKIGIETNRQELKKFGFRNRNIILAALGAGGSIRGLNLKNERPDLMIFEDVQTKECAESYVQSQALERWMFGTAMKAKSPHGCFTLFIGNMYPGDNSILKKLRSNKQWLKFVSGAILDDGTSLWEDLKPLESLIAELDHDISVGHPEIFFSEVMNDTEVGINNRVDLAQLKPWPWGPDEQPQGKFIIIDPSANKMGKDDVAIGYFEVFDGKPGMKEVVELPLSPGNTIRQALLMALKHGCFVIAAESNGYQSTLLYWFDIVAKQLGIEGMHFVEVYSGSASKNARIVDSMKALTASEIVVHQDIKSRVVHQIANWNPLKRNNVDNILDLIAYAPKVLEMYAPIIATNTAMLLEGAGEGGLVEDADPF